MHYFIAWLASKTRPTFSSDQRWNHNHCWHLHVFPRFSSATCNFFEFWLVHCIVSVLCDRLEWLLWFCFNHTQLKAVLKGIIQKTATDILSFKDPFRLLRYQWCINLRLKRHCYNFTKWSLKLCNKNLISSNWTIKSNFLQKVHIAATFLQNFNDFRVILESLKNWHPDGFSKIHIVIRFHPRHR